MKTASEWAEKVLPDFLLEQLPKGWIVSLRHDVAQALTAFREEGVKEAHKDIAMKQALVHGESEMLGGKLVTNEELYKQPVDYVREARAEGVEEGILIGMKRQSMETSESVLRSARAEALEEVKRDIGKMLDTFPLDSKIAAIAVNIKKILDALGGKHER